MIGGIPMHACRHGGDGLYWKPVWHMLEGRFELVRANAAHIKGVRSDTNDAMWIADLLAHDLIRPSFVPPQPIQELRDLTSGRHGPVGPPPSPRRRVPDRRF